MISDKCEVEEININNQTIPVWVYGDRKNPPVFYIHGIAKAFSQNDGDLPIRYLMKDYCVIGFDLPGWGTSTRLKGSSEELITTIASRLGFGKFFIFGTSYGGIVGLWYARLHPGLVRGVIVAGVPRISFQSSLFIFQILGTFLRHHLFIARDMIRLQKNISKVEIPVLLLYSEEDKVAPVSNGIFFEKQLKNAKLVFIKGRSHGWLLHRIIDNDFGLEINKFIKTYS